MVTIVVMYLLSIRHDVDLLGKPLGTDFVSFWTASEQIRSGEAASIYDPEAHHLAEIALFAHARPDFYGFFYPPVFALICIPLAYLAYPLALLCWLSAGFVPVIYLLRRILPQGWAWLPILAYPAWLVNAGHGQNGFLSAVLFGLFMASERLPVLGGSWLGVLIFKPQLAVALPVGLLAARRWREALGCVGAVTLLLLLSRIVFGSGIWPAFFGSTGFARTVLEQGLVDPGKMVSVFAALRLAHASVWLAYGGQIIVAVATLAVLGRVTRGRPGLAAEGAMLAAATCLCTPFLLDYDLTLLAFPLAFLLREALRDGFLPWEKIVMLAAYMLPLCARPLAMLTGIVVAPMVVGALYILLTRRVEMLLA